MTRSEEIALRAMKKELNNLASKAARSKAAYEECLSAASDIIQVRKELSELLAEPERGPGFTEALKQLEKREKRAFRIGKKDIGKLMEKSIDDEITFNDFSRYVQFEESSFNRKFRDSSPKVKG